MTSTLNRWHRESRVAISRVRVEDIGTTAGAGAPS